MNMPPLSYNYKSYRLDSDSPNFAFLTGKYAALSQHALICDPHAFGVAYTTEGAMAPSDYMTRLKRQTMNVFICVAHPADLPVTSHDIEHGAWVGMVTQIGPTTKDLFWLKDSGAPEPLADDLETKWHQTATWCFPDHRGQGIAKQLIETAISHAKGSMKGKVEQTRVRAMIRPSNEVSKSLYIKCGFSLVGQCTPREAMEANGNGSQRYLGKMDINLRNGVIVEKVLR